MGSLSVSLGKLFERSKVIGADPFNELKEGAAARCLQFQWL